MSRCIGCNTELTEGEMCAKHPQTGEYEELCKHCRSPQWDNGYGFDDKGNKIPCFGNEVHLEHNWIGEETLDSEVGIIKHIMTNGAISTQEL